MRRRKAEHGSHTEQHRDLAVRNGQFLKYISMGTASRHQEELVCLRQREPLVTLYNYFLAVCALPWATSTAAPPAAVATGGSSGSVLPHQALSQPRSSLPRHLESSVTRFKCFKILHFQSKNKQSQRCVTENALNTGVLLLTVNRA